MFNFLEKIKPHEDEFITWLCLVEDKPASAGVDCLAYDASGKTMSNLAILTMHGLGTSRNGFPTVEVFNIIYEIEDKIKKATNKSESKYVGRITTDGKQYFLVYTKNPQSVKTRLEKIATESKNYKSEISIRIDKEWKIYFSMLYPAKREKQRFYNALLIADLSKKVNDVKKVRLTDHAIFFKNETERRDFIKELRISGFRYKNYKFIDDNKAGVLTLELHILSPLENQKMDWISDKLIELADKHNGVYDGWGTAV